MSAKENLALVRRFFEAQGEGDLDALDEILAEDCAKGIRNIRNHFLACTALPDFRCMFVFGFGARDSFATRFAGQKAAYRV